MNTPNVGQTITATYTMAAGQTLDAGFIPQLTVAAQDTLSPPLIPSGAASSVFSGDAVATVNGPVVTLTSALPWDVSTTPQTLAYQFALSVSGAVVTTPWAQMTIIATPQTAVTLASIQAAVAATQNAVAAVQSGVSAVASGVAVIPTTALTDAQVQADAQAGAASALVLKGLTSPGAIASSVLNQVDDGSITVKQALALHLAYDMGQYTVTNTPTARTIVLKNQEGQPLATITDALSGGQLAGRTNVAFANLPT